MKTIMFFGDSLTEGQIGASYVDRIATALGGQARVINAGCNGDTAVNLRRRVRRDVAPHNPDLVVLHTGLNDLGTAHAPTLQRIYYRLVKGVLIDITEDHYRMALRAVLREIRLQTRAAVLLCTPTTLSEDPQAPVQAVVERYAEEVRKLALREQLPLADLRAAFWEAINTDPRPGPPYEILMSVRDMLAVGRGKTTYAQLTEQRGYRLLCDGVHLAQAGAELAADVILDALTTLLPTIGIGVTAPQH